jgi:Ca2+/Na+ antiporter
MWGKLLGIASIGEAISSLHMARKFAADIALIVILAIVGSMLAGAMLISGLWECHELLLRHGLDPDMAALVTGLAGLTVLGVIGAVIVYKLTQIRKFPLTLSRNALPIASIQSAVRGFVTGFSRKL